jgi:hypothetical protein
MYMANSPKVQIIFSGLYSFLGNRVTELVNFTFATILRK